MRDERRLVGRFEAAQGGFSEALLAMSNQDMLARVAADVPGAQLVDLRDLVADGVLADRNHLSAEGARKVAERLFPLVEAGLRVAMLDGGQRNQLLPPDGQFLDIRRLQPDQWDWMVGRDFHALRHVDAISPKLRVPTHAAVFEGFANANRIVSEDFVAVGSLAPGGLSNAWGCGVACLTDAECAPSQHCVNLTCQGFTSCTNSLGCQSAVAPNGSSQPICDKAIGECAACVADVDCPPNHECKQCSCYPSPSWDPQRTPPRKSYPESAPRPPEF